MAGSLIRRRTAEIGTAVAVALTGAVVVAESLTHDIGWNETGPGSGYFPFRIGLLLIAAASVRAMQSIRGAGPASEGEHLASRPAGTFTPFVTREEFARSKPAGGFT